jgi:hypothetical protein
MQLIGFGFVLMHCMAKAVIYLAPPLLSDIN